MSLWGIFRRSLDINVYPTPPPPPVECIAIVKPAGVPIWILWQLGRDDASHVPASLNYPRGGRLEMDRDQEGQSRGYDMTSLHTVPCHISDMGRGLAGREI